MTREETEAWVRSLKKHRYMEAKSLTCSGVYLIYERGRLLYVGESADIGTRLCYHHANRNSGNLFWHLVDDTPKSASFERAHHCTCGKLIRCPNGNRTHLPSSRPINKRFQAFRVLVGEFPTDDPRRFQYEKDCQEYLEPRYPLRKNKPQP